MGPDEFATREEVGVLMKYAFAKIRQQAEIIGALGNLLVSEGKITDAKLNEMLLGLENSPIQKQARDREKILQDFLTIHKTARQYLDPPSE